MNQENSTIAHIRKVFKAIKDIILRDIRNLFDNQEEENCYKPVRVSNFSSYNYVEYESNHDRKINAVSYKRHI